MWVLPWQFILLRSSWTLKERQRTVSYHIKKKNFKGVSTSRKHTRINNLNDKRSISKIGCSKKINISFIVYTHFDKYKFSLGIPSMNPVRILKKINISFIVHSHFGKYKFSLGITLINTVRILKKMNVSVIVHFCLGKYSFSLDTFLNTAFVFAMIMSNVFFFKFKYNKKWIHLLIRWSPLSTMNMKFNLLFFVEGIKSGWNIQSLASKILIGWLFVMSTVLGLFYIDVSFFFKEL